MHRFSESFTALQGQRCTAVTDFVMKRKIAAAGLAPALACIRRQDCRVPAL